MRAELEENVLVYHFRVNVRNFDAVRRNMISLLSPLLLNEYDILVKTNFIRVLHTH